MNKFGAQALGRSFLSLLFAGDDPRHLLPDSRNRGAERPGFGALAPATAKGRKKP